MIAFILHKQTCVTRFEFYINFSAAPTFHCIIVCLYNIFKVIFYSLLLK